jgi:hypothetical protein
MAAVGTRGNARGHLADVVHAQADAAIICCSEGGGPPIKAIVLVGCNSYAGTACATLSFLTRQRLATQKLGGLRYNAFTDCRTLRGHGKATYLTPSRHRLAALPATGTVARVPCPPIGHGERLGRHAPETPLCRAPCDALHSLRSRVPRKAEQRVAAAGQTGEGHGVGAGFGDGLEGHEARFGRGGPAHHKRACGIKL